MINNPRDTLREAAKENLIDDPKEWFNYLENRNLTSHVYNEDIAERIYSALPPFKKALDNFINNIVTL